MPRNLNSYPCGCDFEDVVAAVASHSAYDTIEITNGPRLYRLSAPLALKKGVTLLSTTAARDTLEGLFSSRHMIWFLGDSVTLYNLYARFPRNGDITTWAFMVGSENSGGHKIVQCYFKENGDDYPDRNLRRGICLERLDSSVATLPSLIRHCIFDSLEACGGTNGAYHRQATHVTIDSCIVNGKVGRMGSHFVIRHNVFLYGNGEIDIDGDSLLIEYNYFNGRGDGGEMLSGDEQTRHSHGCIVRYNTLDSVGHMGVCHDGVRGFEAYGNNIISPYDKEVPAFGSHGTDVLDICDDVRIFNNTIGGKVLMIRGENIGHSDIAFLRNLCTVMRSPCVAQTWCSRAVRDTIDKCVYYASTLPEPYIAGNFDAICEVRYGVALASVLIDTTQRYPYLKRGCEAFFGGDSVYAGCRKYLVNFNSAPYALAANGFTVDDSIDINFWYNNPVAKDRGTVTLQTALRAEGPWIHQSSSGVQKAGSTDNLTAHNVSGTVWYRLLFKGSGQVSFVEDTTEARIVTLDASALSNQSRISRLQPRGSFAAYYDISCRKMVTPRPAAGVVVGADDGGKKTIGLPGLDQKVHK